MKTSTKMFFPSIPRALQIIAFTLLLPILTPSVSAKAAYDLDKAHSSIGFAVSHMMLSHVKGWFDEFDGKLAYDKKTNQLTEFEGTVKVASINTRNAKRDEHLKSPDFFNEATFKDISFKMTKFTRTKKETTVTGNLRIRDKTKSVTLTVTNLHTVKDPWGNQRVGFSAKGKINRDDFGITWNKLLETGGLVVGKEVTLDLQIEGVAKALPAKEPKK